MASISNVSGIAAERKSRNAAAANSRWIKGVEYAPVAPAEPVSKSLTRINALVKDIEHSIDYIVGMSWHGYHLRQLRKMNAAIKRKQTELAKLFKAVPGSARLKAAAEAAFHRVKTDHHERSYPEPKPLPMAQFKAILAEMRAALKAEKKRPRC